jgi:hypothetical protein
VHQSVLAREECEGVMRGATGGQRKGRNEVQNEGNWTDDRTRPRQNGQEGGMSSVGKEAKDIRRLPSPPCTCRVVNCVCVWGGRRVVVYVMNQPHIKGVGSAVLRVKVGSSHTRGRGSQPKRWQTPPEESSTVIGWGSGVQIRSCFRDDPPNVRRTHTVTWEAFWPLIG